VCDVPCHSCHVDSHWSADGTHVAILNNRLLDGGRYTRNGPLLVNPLTGARSERISLDDMIIQEAQIPTKCACPGEYQFEQTPTVKVRQAIWALLLRTTDAIIWNVRDYLECGRASLRMMSVLAGSVLQA